MMSLTFGLFTQVSGSGPLGPLVYRRLGNNLHYHYGFLSSSFLTNANKVLHKPAVQRDRYSVFSYYCKQTRLLPFDHKN